ncbi:sialic acid-binding Ig-like lectin 15 [Colossoma macropomum]|uniref:sialic acid-binding Ig-like lectin 15 n=1 Tax=Colossoma macropomum TaxID=42526 RepID=UPI0018649EE7|nr:sialic acid-binding Ig-like lectin 15 [Colossoma macropomum]
MELIQMVFFLCGSPGLLAADKWSMTVPKAVNQTIGQDAIIPCTFTTPYTDYQNIITVIWRMKCQYNGLLIFRCVSKGNPSESGQNCIQSTGRYSLSGDPRRNNISLKIKNISFSDAEKYFCRVELSNKQDQYGTVTGTTLNVQVTQALERIYIQTLPSGEQFVTCDVKGTPPPTVMWIIPDNANASLVSVQSGFAGASSSIPANLPNTNYTCQIHGKNGTQHLSIYYRGAQEQQQQIPSVLLIAFVILSGVFFILFLVTLAVLYKKGKEQTHHLFTIKRLVHLLTGIAHF